MVTTDTLHLVWALARERPTLGGSLVLRQEGELLAALHRETSATIHVQGASPHDPVIKHLAETVFASSACHFRLTEEPAPETKVWPSASDRTDAAFSAFSFSRVLALHRTHGLAPHLTWHREILQCADSARARFKGRLICLHLRSVSPFAVEESNADGPVWAEFLRARAQPGVLEFLLLGDDPLPVGLTLPAGAHRARDLGLDLALQLALVSKADAFLGMASGLCTAANFSATPHILFKHPAHHPAQMLRELGDVDRFPFASTRQRLWRKAVTVELLHEALTLVLS